MQLRFHLLLASLVWFAPVLAQDGDGTTQSGNTPAAKFGSSGGGGGGAAGGQNTDSGPQIDEDALGDDDTPTLAETWDLRSSLPADIFPTESSQISGGTVIFDGPDVRIRVGPFKVDLPGQPPVVTSDDVVLIILTDPGTGFREQFLVSTPETLTKGVKVPVLVAFHKSGNTMLDITSNTTFAEESRARGWFMLAPLGASTRSFSSLPSQINTEAALDVFLKRYGQYVDTNRIYGVGFSMGGGNVLNYAARHVDTTKPMFAAIVNHTGGLDLADTYVKDSSSNSFLDFWNGGPPGSFPFNYHRSSVIVKNVSALGFARHRSLGRNLTHVPILDVRAEFDDVDTAYLLPQNFLFESMMGIFGGNVTVDIKAGIANHLWATLSEVEALDFLEQHRLKLPTFGRHLADRNDRFFYFDVVQDASGDFSPFEWEVTQRTNAFALSETENFESIAFDPVELGLSLNETLIVHMGTNDNLADDLILKGFAKAPVEILRDGVPTASYVYEPFFQVLKLLETDGTATHTWHITTTAAAADVRVALFVDDSAPLEGDTVTYNLVTRNVGPSMATGVSIDNLLPAGLTFSSATPTKGTYTSGTGEWDLGTLDAKEVVTLEIEATVDVGTGGDLIVSTASVSTLTQVDAKPSNDISSISLTVDNNADLEVTKSVDNDRPKAGEQVVYTISVTNLAPGAQATTLTVSDSLPSGVTYVSDVASLGSYDSGLGIWTLGTLNSGGTATLDITVSVDPGTIAQLITNTASILAFDQTDPNGANDSDSAALLVVDDVDLAVSKIVDDATPHEQDEVVYTITVTNTSGTVAASSVSLTDALPAGVTYVSEVVSQGTYVDATGVWTVGALAAGASATLDITAGVDVGTGGMAIINTVSGLSSDQPDPNAVNDTDSAQIDVDTDADLSVTKVVDDATPTEQDQVVYTITVSNPVGAAEATNVSLVDLLPAGVSYVSDNASQGTYVDGSGLWSIGTISAGSSATLDITASVDVGSAGLAVVNTADTLLADQPDSDGLNNSDTAQIDVSNLADISVTKTVDDAAPYELDDVVYTITVSNQVGGAQATNLSVTDLLPTGVTYSSDIASQGSYVSGTGVWSLGSLASGASATLMITANVDAATVGSTIVNNVAGLSLDQTDPNASNDTDSASFLVVADVDLALTKTVDDATPMELGTIVYTLTVSNTSATVAASSVSVNDLLPSGVTYSSDLASQGSYDDNTGLWSVGAIGALSNATLDITAIVDSATAGMAIVNTANGLMADQPDPNGANDSDTAQIDVDTEADLSVVKVVDTATPAELSQVIYTITVSNPIGGALATGVSLTDVLPAGVSYVSDVPSQGSYNDVSGFWTVGSIAANSNATLAITASVDVGTAGNAIINTTSALALDQTDSNATNDVGTVQIDVDTDADLAVAKVVDDAIPNEQDSIVYTITVTNPIGAAQATTVSLNDMLPAGVTYVSDVPSQGSYDDGSGLWLVGTINANASATLDITATVDVGTAGTTIVNTADTLSADQPDSDVLNNTDSASIVVSDEADLSVAKIVDDATPLESGTVVYTITIANPSGGAQATGITLTDLLPAGVTYVSDVPSQGSFNDVSGLWTVGTISAGANATLDITTTVDVGTGGEAIINTTSLLTLDQTDSNALNDVGSIQIDVDDEADLAVTKVVDDATPLESGTIVYTITLTNTPGGAEATGVTLSDLLPAGVTYVSDVASQGSYVSGSGLWTVGTLATGASATLDITATVDVTTGGSLIVNTASAPALDQTDSNATNDSDSASITVDDGADLAVTKIVDDASPIEGGTVVYTIEVSNLAGGATATNVSVTDALPSGVTYVSDSASQGSFVDGTGIWTVGSLLTGISATLDLTCTVDAATSGTAIVNTTSALALDQTDSNASNDVGSVQIDVEPDLDLSVDLSVDDATPAEQDTIVYTVTITNGSAVDSATSLLLTDFLPAGVTYVSEVASQGSYVSGTGVWTIGTLGALASATLDITATVDVSTGGDAIVNTTTGLAFDQFDSNSANDVGSIQIDVLNDADLSVTKVVDDATPLEAGTVVYTITVSNPGGGAQATSVALTDLLPAGVTYVSDVSSQGTYVDGSGLWTIGTINAGANATLDITVTVDASTTGTTITNTTSSLGLDQTDSNATNDVGSVGITVN